MRKTLLFGLMLGSLLLTKRADCQIMDYGRISDQEYFYAFTEATRHYLFGHYVQAVGLYKECLRIKPQSSAAHFQLSKIFLNSGNVPLAREHAKKANEFSPDNKWYLQELGDIYQMEQKYDSAIIVFKEMISVENDNVNIVFGIAALYEKLSQFEEALSYLDQVDSRIGPSREVSLSRYRIYESLNQPEKAISQLKAAYQLSGEDYSLAGIIAEFYRAHNLPDSAMKYYQVIFPRHNSDAVVVFSYADFLIEKGSLDSAKLLILEVMKDTSMEHSAKLSFFYNTLRDEKDFIGTRPILDTITEAFIRGHENDVRSLAIYSDVMLRLGKYERASYGLRRIVDRDASNYPAIEQLIYTLNILGKPDSVLYYSGLAIQLFSDKPVLYLFNGSAQYQKKNYENALNVLNKGLSLTEDNTLKIEFYSLMAESFQGLAKYEESESAFISALALDENNLGIKNNYAYYLSLREKDLKLAKKMSFATIKAEPENSTYLDTYAWILFKAGKVNKARKYVLRALKYGGEENEEILRHSAEIHLKLKDYREGLKYLKKVLELAGPEEIERIRQKIRETETLEKN